MAKPNIAWPDSQILLNCVNKAVRDIEEQTKHLKNADSTIKNKDEAFDLSTFGTICGDMMVLWSNMLGIHKTLFQEMVNLSSSSAQGSDTDGLSSGFSMMLARVVDADRCVRQVIATIRDTTWEGGRSNGQTDNLEKPSAGSEASALKRTQSQSNTPKRRKIGVGTAIPVQLPATVTEDRREESIDSIGPSASRKMRKPRGKKPTVEHESHDMAPPAVSLEQQRRTSFEDITADVAAAVKAKEEKRRLKKESKKRKRESVASSILEQHSDVELDLDLRTRFAMSGLGETGTSMKRKDQPPKKKAKLKSGVAATGGGIPSAGEDSKTTDSGANLGGGAAHEDVHTTSEPRRKRMRSTSNAEMHAETTMNVSQGRKRAKKSSHG